MQAPSWTDFLQCSICTNKYNCSMAVPVSLSCSHSMCKRCIARLQTKQCPYDKTSIPSNLDQYPPNTAFLLLLGYQPDNWIKEMVYMCPTVLPDAELDGYTSCREAVEKLALFLKPFMDQGVLHATASIPRPLLKKLTTLLSCQILDGEGRVKALRAAHSIAERIITELLVMHQNQQQISSVLWSAVRVRGCQFLGPVMQEEALKLILKVLENRRFLSRKNIVLYVVQQIRPDFHNASKTNIGHVVQLLYRASCFNVEKREGDSSLMQLKEEFCTYEALRREHDAQIIKIAMEAGLRISPENWSTQLYGTTSKKSEMQSIIDKLLSMGVGSSGLSELIVAIGRSQDPYNLNEKLVSHLDALLKIDVPLEKNNETKGDGETPFICSWESCTAALQELLISLQVFTDFTHVQSGRYKTGMCPYLSKPGGCPRGALCPYAHSEDERKKYVTMAKPKPRLKPHPEIPHHSPPSRPNNMPHRGDMGGSLPLPHQYSGELGSLADSPFSSLEHSSSFPGSGGNIIYPPETRPDSTYFVRPGGPSMGHTGFFQREMPPTPTGYNNPPPPPPPPPAAAAARFGSYDGEVMFDPSTGVMSTRRMIPSIYQQSSDKASKRHALLIESPPTSVSSYPFNEFEPHQEHPSGSNHGNELAVDMVMTGSSTDSTPVTTSQFYPPPTSQNEPISATLSVDAWSYNNKDERINSESLGSSLSEGEDLEGKLQVPYSASGDCREKRGDESSSMVSRGGAGVSPSSPPGSDKTVEELQERIKMLELRLEEKEKVDKGKEEREKESISGKNEQVYNHTQQGYGVPPPPLPLSHPQQQQPYYSSPQNSGYIGTVGGTAGPPPPMSLQYTPQPTFMAMTHPPSSYYDPFMGLSNQLWCPQPVSIPAAGSLHATPPNSGLIVHHGYPHPQQMGRVQLPHPPPHHQQHPSLQEMNDEYIAHFVAFQEQSKAPMGMVAPGAQLSSIPPSNSLPIHHRPPPVHNPYGFEYHLMTARPY